MDGLAVCVLESYHYTGYRASFKLVFILKSNTCDPIRVSPLCTEEISLPVTMLTLRPRALLLYGSSIAYCDTVGLCPARWAVSQQRLQVRNT